jgi:hypothetical protein
MKLRGSDEETLEILQTACGIEAVGQAAVFWWWIHFRERNKRLIDDTKIGRPSTPLSQI